MITYKKVLVIHKLIIDKFGGTHGIRDENLLKSALLRPYSGIESKEFYPNFEDKAAALFESIITNHPFIDGNKRTAYVLMRLTLLNANLDIDANEDDKFKFVLLAAEGKLNFDQIINWVKTHLVQKGTRG